MTRDWEDEHMTLVEFLTARLNEDQAGAGLPGSEGRLLREVEAKRAIIAEHWDAGPGPGKGSGIGWCGRCDSGNYGAVDWPCPTIRALAAVYAEHPDYREKWRP